MNRQRGALLIAASLVLAGTVVLHQRASGVIQAGAVSMMEQSGNNALCLLMILPAGVCLTAIVRLLAGIPTFGTLAPSLLAVGLVHSRPIESAVIVLVALAASLASRAIFGRLRMLFIARMGLVLTLVVATVGLVLPLVYTAGSSTPAHVFLLPVFILTMVVEHFYVAAEREGYKPALLVLCATLMTAGICLVLFRIRVVQELATSFPETLLFVAAILVLVGTYRGYRLSELIRFRWMGSTGTGEDCKP